MKSWLHRSSISWHRPNKVLFMPNFLCSFFCNFSSHTSLKSVMKNLGADFWVLIRCPRWNHLDNCSYNRTYDLVRLAEIDFSVQYLFLSYAKLVAWVTWDVKSVFTKPGYQGKSFTLTSWRSTHKKPCQHLVSYLHKSNL